MPTSSAARQMMMKKNHQMDESKKHEKAKGDKKEDKKEKKVAKVMHEFKKKGLHSGKGGKLVKSRKQAIAIALSEASRV